MARSVLDGDLKSWEVFASTGRYGFPRPSRLLFRNLTDPAARPRALEHEGDHSDAEAWLARAAPAELREALERSVPLE